MDTILSRFSDDHLHCDKLFCNCEDYAQQQEWQQVQIEFRLFAKAMALHFEKEEEVLFPSLIHCSARAIGPTQVMRDEHTSMRELMQDMQLSIDKLDYESFLGLSETLLIMMQQHNNKEENILYRMADEVLGTEIEEVLANASALKS